MIEYTLSITNKRVEHISGEDYIYAGIVKAKTLPRVGEEIRLNLMKLEEENNPSVALNSRNAEEFRGIYVVQRILYDIRVERIHDSNEEKVDNWTAWFEQNPQPLIEAKKI